MGKNISPCNDDSIDSISYFPIKVLSDYPHYVWWTPSMMSYTNNFSKLAFSPGAS